MHANACFLHHFHHSHLLRQVGHSTARLIDNQWQIELRAQQKNKGCLKVYLSETLGGSPFCNLIT